MKRVAEGGRYVEREIAGELAFAQLSTEDPLQQLSTREIEILRLLGEGNSLTEIAQSIGVARWLDTHYPRQRKEKSRVS